MFRSNIPSPAPLVAMRSRASLSRKAASARLRSVTSKFTPKIRFDLTSA
jgi:hypothetical protein